jgi:hypothetical protein
MRSSISKVVVCLVLCGVVPERLLRLDPDMAGVRPHELSQDLLYFSQVSLFLGLLPLGPVKGLVQLRNVVWIEEALVILFVILVHMHPLSPLITLLHPNPLFDCLGLLLLELYRKLFSIFFVFPYNFDKLRENSLQMFLVVSQLSNLSLFTIEKVYPMLLLFIKQVLLLNKFNPFPLKLLELAL